MSNQEEKRKRWLRNTILGSLLGAGLGGVLLRPAAEAGGKDAEPVTCVTLAKTWDEAVAEARMLSVPIVVHSHGFYCGPCWGMHSSVMCNDKYIGFADDNTVEVISLSRLDEGIEKDDRRAATYEAKAGGETVKYMVEFPGMTTDQMLALNRSKAASYNNTGGVPYTCVVDPFTLEEIKNWPGGGHSAKSLIEEIGEIGETLRKEHPVGLKRKDLRKYEEAEADANAEAKDGDYTKALKELEKGTKKASEWPEELQARVAAARTGIIDQATKCVDDVEALIGTDAKEARKQIGRLKSKIKGTGLEDRLAALDAQVREALAAK